MPLVSVVLPEPRSPVKRTSTGGRRRLANSLPHCVVSSAECVMTASLTRLQLLKELVAGVGNGGGNFGGEQSGLVGSFRCELGGLALQGDGQRENARSIIGLQLRG